MWSIAIGNSRVHKVGFTPSAELKNYLKFYENPINFFSRALSTNHVMKLLSLAAAALLFVTSAFSFTSELTQTSSNEEMNQILRTAQKGDLVVLDCDEVILRLKDRIYREEDGLDFIDKEVERIKRFNPNLAKLLDIVSSDSIGLELLNPDLPELVDDLQNRGVKVLVLTAITNSLQERINDLRHFGFDFARSWKGSQPITFYRSCDNRALKFQYGVMASGDIPKGEALQVVFDYLLDEKPRKIFFSDDRLYNIDSMQQTFENKINLHCIRYTASMYTPFKYSSSFLKLSFIMKYFLINGIWLSNEKADSEMFKRLSPEAGIPTSVNAIRGNELIAFPRRYFEFRKAMSLDNNVRNAASAKENIASRCIRCKASPFPFHRNSSSSLRATFALNYFLINGVVLPNEEVDKEVFKRLK